MSREFTLAEDHHGFTTRDLRQVTEQAIMAAFCSLPTKERLLTEVIHTGFERMGA
jgi:adenosine deaminase